MRFAGLALEPAMLPAFAHASAPASGAPELEILLWDSDSTGVRGPRPPWGRGDVRARGDVCGYEDPEVSVVSDHGSGGITVFHRGRAMIVYWVADSRVIPWYESAAPLRAALHHWAAGANRHLVHAGAVGSGGAGVLVAGPSGSGKSTTALASLEAGLEYAGDDYVILDPGHPPVAHCLYSTAKLDAAALARLPGLAAAVSDFRRGEETKAVLSLHAYRPDLLRRSLRVDAIVLPTIGRDGGPGLRPATAAATLRALAPSSLLQLPGAGQAGMSTMAGLVRRVPAFHLELGPEIAAVPKLVAEVCAEAARNRVSAPAQDQG
jgi:hypothetical protein